MGVKVSGAGTSVIRITGSKKKLNNVEHSVIPDRIVAGTYLVAAGITGGDLTLKNIVAEHISSIVSYLREAGCCIDLKRDSLHIYGPTRPRSIDVIRTPALSGFSYRYAVPVCIPFINCKRNQHCCGNYF